MPPIEGDRLSGTELNRGCGSVLNFSLLLYLFVVEWDSMQNEIG